MSMREPGDRTPDDHRRSRRDQGAQGQPQPHLSGAVEAERERVELDHLKRTVAVAEKAVARFVDGLWDHRVQEGYLRKDGEKATELATALMEAMGKLSEGTPSAADIKLVLKEITQIVGRGQRFVQGKVREWLESVESHHRLGGGNHSHLVDFLLGRLRDYNCWVAARTLATSHDVSMAKTGPDKAASIVTHRLADFTASIGVRVDQKGVPNSSRRVSDLTPAAVDHAVDALKKIWLQAVVAEITAERVEEQDVPNLPVETDGSPKSVFAAAFEEIAVEDACDIRAELVGGENHLNVRLVLSASPELEAFLAARLNSGATTELDEMVKALNVIGADNISMPTLTMTSEFDETRAEVTLSFSIPFISKAGQKAGTKDLTHSIFPIARYFDPVVPEYIRVAESSHGAPIIVAGSLLLNPRVGYDIRRALKFANSCPGVQNILVYESDHGDLPLVAINVKHADEALTGSADYHRVCVEMLKQGKFDETIKAECYHFDTSVGMSLHDLEDDGIADAIRYLIDVTEKNIDMNLGAFLTFGPNAMIEFVDYLKSAVTIFEKQSGLPLESFGLKIDSEGTFLPGSHTIEFHIQPQGCSTALDGVFYSKNGVNRMLLRRIASYMAVPNKVARALYEAAYNNEAEVFHFQDTGFDDGGHAAFAEGEADDGAQVTALSQSVEFANWIQYLNIGERMPFREFRTALVRWLFDNNHMIMGAEGTYYINNVDVIMDAIGNEEEGDDGDEHVGGEYDSPPDASPDA